jgi:hypothetical protein
VGHHFVLGDLADILKGQATGVIEMELAEMECLFALLVMGSLTGLPLPPSAVGMRLLPHIEPELEQMLSRAGTLDDMLATLAGRIAG